MHHNSFFILALLSISSFVIPPVSLSLPVPPGMMLNNGVIVTQKSAGVLPAKTDSL
jgi:hypothetical protein